MRQLWLIFPLLLLNTAFNNTPIPIKDYEVHIEEILPTTQDSLCTLLEYTLKAHESFRNKAYWDYKQHTIGWGTKGKRNEYLTIEEADSRFQETLDKYYNRIQEEYPLLEDGKLIATVIMAYNVSDHAIKKAKRTNAKLKKGDKPPFHLWVNAGGKRLEGLVKRRHHESKIWDNWREVYDSKEFSNHQNKVDGIYQSQATTKTAN